MGYLVADKVLAYDGNRGLIRGAVRHPWTSGRGLLYLIATFEPQAHRPFTTIVRPRVSDHGALVLAL